MRTLRVKERLSGFLEAGLGFTKQEALAEANCCLLFSSGSCSGYTMCANSCPVYCIHVERTTGQPGRKVVRYDLDLTKCMFCGMCAVVCPTGALEMSKDYENAEIYKGQPRRDKNRRARTNVV